MLMREKRVINLNFDPFNIINKVRFWSVDIFKKKKKYRKNEIHQNRVYHRSKSML